VVAACTAVGVTLVSALCIVEVLGYSYKDFQLGRLMEEANAYAIGILVPAGGVGLLLIPKMRDDDDEFDIVDTTFENGMLFFSRRDSIHQRIKRILTHYRDQFDRDRDAAGRPELVIVSHSQGTMAAIEILNDEELSWLNNSFSSVSLVTMGSPLFHIYQHYFGHIYPALDQPYWVSLRRRIDRWTNICRIDDFVGTEILFAKNQANARSGVNQSSQIAPNQGVAGLGEARSQGAEINFSNQAVGPRGHTDYWSDLEVLALLRPILLGKSSSDSAGRSVGRAA